MVRATQIPSAMAAPTTTLATARVQVLLPPDGGRFTAYCARHGFNKSTLIARLVGEYLEREAKSCAHGRTKRVRTGRGTRGI